MRLISSAGFATETFVSGAEFMQAARDRLPGCVVLDLHMPEMSGFEVQQLLREAKAQVPVLIITGLDTAEARSEALALGVRAYLAKPVDGEVLLEAIRGVLQEQNRSQSPSKETGRFQ
jgi:two-component system response regulator FixJ